MAGKRIDTKSGRQNPNIEIDISKSGGLRKLKKYLDKMTEEIASEYLSDIADAVLTNSQDRLYGKEELENSTDPDGGAYNTGELVESAVAIKISPTIIEIGYEAAHAQKVEYGTLPTDPGLTIPVKKDPLYRKILKWAKNKGIFADVETVAFFVTRNIKMLGLKPRPYLRSALEWVRPRGGLIAAQTEKRMKERYG